jgi:hypothetical protein
MSASARPQTWPTVPVWVSLHSRPGFPPIPTGELTPDRSGDRHDVPLPRSVNHLVTWYATTRRALTSTATAAAKRRHVPVWLWVETEQGRPVARVSLEREAGVPGRHIPLPADETELRRIHDAAGQALTALTGLSPEEAIHAAKKEQTVRAGVSRVKTLPAVLPKRETPPKARKNNRKMVLPLARIVPGGAPTLGKRR